MIAEAVSISISAAALGITIGIVGVISALGRIARALERIDQRLAIRTPPDRKEQP